MTGKHPAPSTQYSMTPVGFCEAVQPWMRCAGPSALSAAVRPSAGASVAPNKANFRLFWAENSDSVSKQSQLLQAGDGRPEAGGNRLSSLSSFVQNKPNFRCFWTDNAGWAKKQSQSKPIFTTPEERIQEGRMERPTRARDVGAGHTEGEKTGERGLEPRLTEPESGSTNSQTLPRTELSNSEIADLSRNLSDLVQLHPDVADLLNVWPNLSEELRLAIFRIAEVR
jgi:hypothetical protein